MRTRIRAAGIALHDGHVLLHKMHKMDDFWVLPGGGVEHETTMDGLKREFQEELGIEVTVKQLLWVVENFFEHNNKQVSGIEFHYLIEVPSKFFFNQKKNFDGYEQETDETLHFEWHKLSGLDCIKLLPSFLLEQLKKLETSTPQIVEHIINNEIGS
jgi:8-oxo-dGTP pyrophosphatase MutT (NUDIX family)